MGFTFEGRCLLVRLPTSTTLTVEGLAVSQEGNHRLTAVNVKVRDASTHL